MACQYSRETLRLFQQIKRAFDPDNLANPSKIIPVHFEDKTLPAPENDVSVLAMAQKIKNRFNQKHSTTLVGTNTQLKSHAADILSAAELNRILEIDKTNYMAVVQAGVKTQDLLRELEKQGVYTFLPPSYTGSIGGLTACKAYPAFIRQITGVQAILPNGDIVNYGGKIMKNAAGYNLCRLFAGSAGALGMITKLTFKIYATPQTIENEAKPLFSFEPDSLFRAVKNEVDPLHLFRTAAFGEVNE